MGFGLLVLAAYALTALYDGRTGQAGAALAAWLRAGLGAAAGPAVVVAGGVGWGLLRAGSAGSNLRALGAGVLLVGAAAVVTELAGRAVGPTAKGPWQTLGRYGGGLAGRQLVAWLYRTVGEAGLLLAAAVAVVLAASLALRVSPAYLLAFPFLALRRGLVGLARVGRAGWAAAAWGARTARAGMGRMAARRHGPTSTPVDVSMPAAASPKGAQGSSYGEREAREGRRGINGGSAALLAPPADPAPLSAPGGLADPRKTALANGGEAGRETSLPGGPGIGGGHPEAEPGRVPAGLRATAAHEGERTWSAGPVGRWKLPSTHLLARPPSRRRGADDQEVQERSRLLERTLASFGVEARVVSHTRGPTITRYELALPPGIKLSRVVSLADDLSLALASTGVRIEAPVAGKPVVGVEVPNGQVDPVYLREVLEHPAFAKSPAPLTLALGKDVAGQPVVGDLERLIHLLIAGATGSGKSVCLASIIMSLLFRLTPDQLRLLLIDPKRVELTVYEGVPHLLAPVVTEVKQAALALRWAVREMEARYQQLARAGARHLAAYNQMAARGQVEGPLPYLVVVIDELADLMMAAPAEVEDSICRLAQMARAAGIHLVIATQRPSTDVITGLIKANIPSRLAFAVSSQVDSRTILDTGGAERLLGRGDMLYHPLGEPKPLRAQGCLVTERDIEQVVRFWKDQGRPQYAPDVFVEPAHSPEAGDDEDSLYEEAVRLVTQAGQASVSLLQRRFRIGYARAARLIDLMEQRGVVGPYQGSKPREVLAPHRRREHSA